MTNANITEKPEPAKEDKQRLEDLKSGNLPQQRDLNVQGILKDAPKISDNTCLSILLDQVDEKEFENISTLSKMKIQSKDPRTTIFLDGDRGTGKSRLVNKLAKIIKDPKVQNAIKADQTKQCNNIKQISVLSVNCASFADDNMAEAELFGYDPGTFSGGLKDGKEGLFKNADNGILFLDEIHHLSKRVQAKLLAALQPDKDGKRIFHKLGSPKPDDVTFILIAASNKSIPELREQLLDDFYDRIVQNVVKFKPLREECENIKRYWKDVWGKKFPKEQVPDDKLLIDWLEGKDDDKLQLYGNFRDLEAIASYYHVQSRLTTEDTNNEILKKVKEEFCKYRSVPSDKMNLTNGKNESEKNISVQQDITDNGKIIGISENRCREIIEKYMKQEISDKPIKKIKDLFNLELLKWSENEFDKKNAANRLGISEKCANNWKKDSGNTG